MDYLKFSGQVSKRDCLIQRCFAFEPSDNQDDDDKNIIMIPNQSIEQTSFYMHTMVNDIATTLLKKFQKISVDLSNSPCIYSPPPLESEEVLKQKKKSSGRLFKLMGDLCLLSGSLRDASEK